MDIHFPVSTLFNVVEYRKATKRFLDAEETIEKIDRLQSKFKEVLIPVQLLSTEERSAVAIVFERINRMGMELDTFQLLSAWTWNDEFDLQNEFKDLRDDLDEFGFSDVGEDSNLILRSTAAILLKDPSPDKLIGMNGADIRKQFPKVINGIKGAIDFLRTQLNVRNIKNLPYDALLTPLSVFFAVDDKKELSYDDRASKIIRTWFWRSCFGNRYSSQTKRTVIRDIEEIIKLRNTGRSDLAKIHLNIDEKFFRDTYFRIGTANSKTFVLLLANNSPKSFISGNDIDLDKVLQKYNKPEFHHIYPRSFLRSVGVNDVEANNLANFAIISSAENKKIGGKAPSEYIKIMPKNKSGIKEIYKSALLPVDFSDDDYKKFLDNRISLLVLLAKKYCDLQ